MKKMFLFVMAILIMVATLGFKVQSVKAGSAPQIQYLPPYLDLYSPEFEGLSPGTRISVQMFVDSDFHQGAYCAVSDRSGYVHCQFPKKYVDFAATLYLTVNGQNLVFNVTIPKQEQQRTWYPV